MSMKKITTVLLSVLILGVFIFSGCSAARKPAPAPNNPAPNQTNQTDMADAKARRIARVADQVDGVKQSSVVVSGSVAYVGLDIKSNIEKSRTVKLEQDVIDRVKKAEPTINRVYVTSDADTVTRIKKVAQGVAQGQPVSTFARELEEIGRRIAPRNQ